MATAPLDQVKEWFDGIERSSGDCTLVVTLQDEKRRQKKTALRQLEELIADNAVENEALPVVWERHGYRFKFTAGKYFWNDKELYVTANEALFLYRWLILDDDICKTQRYYLRNMRRRLGKEFLAEAVE
jgi:uncharacterized protein (UPF0216 family)